MLSGSAEAVAIEQAHQRVPDAAALPAQPVQDPSLDRDHDLLLQQLADQVGDPALCNVLQVIPEAIEVAGAIGNEVAECGGGVLDASDEDASPLLGHGCSLFDLHGPVGEGSGLSKQLLLHVRRVAKRSVPRLDGVSDGPTHVVFVLQLALVALTRWTDHAKQAQLAAHGVQKCLGRPLLLLQLNAALFQLGGRRLQHRLLAGERHIPGLDLLPPFFGLLVSASHGLGVWPIQRGSGNLRLSGIASQGFGPLLRLPVLFLGARNRIFPGFLGPALLVGKIALKLPGIGIDVRLCDFAHFDGATTPTASAGTPVSRVSPGGLSHTPDIEFVRTVGPDRRGCETVLRQGDPALHLIPTEAN